MAFKVSVEDIPECKTRLLQLGVEIKSPRNRIEGEGESLYFYDFDDHLFELHTGTLDERLRHYYLAPEAGVVDLANLK